MLYACKGTHTLFTSQRERKGEIERDKERERGRERKTEKKGGGERKRERGREREMLKMVIEFISLLFTMAALKGMTGALAHFSYL